MRSSSLALSWTGSVTPQLTAFAAVPLLVSASMTAAGTVAVSISWNVFGTDASQKLMRLSLTVMR